MANTAYCLRCKVQREINGPVEVERNGKGGSVRRAVQGTCATCGFKLSRWLKRDAVVEPPEEQGAAVAEPEAESDEGPDSDTIRDGATNDPWGSIPSILDAKDWIELPAGPYEELAPPGDTPLSEFNVSGKAPVELVVIYDWCVSHGYPPIGFGNFLLECTTMYWHDIVGADVAVMLHRSEQPVDTEPEPEAMAV